MELYFLFDLELLFDSIWIESLAERADEKLPDEKIGWNFASLVLVLGRDREEFTEKHPASYVIWTLISLFFQIKDIWRAESAASQGVHVRSI